MACTRVYALSLLLVLIWESAVSASERADGYVNDACSVTRYRDLCIHTLSSFSDTAKNSPTKWARAGVSVTLSEVKSVTEYLVNLQMSKRLRGKRSRVALSDCVESFQDATDELHKSLGALRKIISKRQYFDAVMGDILTWMSAVLTYEDTCLDGFEGQNGRLVNMLRKKVLKASYMTSNALALVNRLASAGVGSEPNS